MKKRGMIEVFINCKADSDRRRYFRIFCSDSINGKFSKNSVSSIFKGYLWRAADRFSDSVCSGIFQRNIIGDSDRGEER